MLFHVPIAITQEPFSPEVGDIVLDEAIVDEDVLKMHIREELNKNVEKEFNPDQKSRRRQQNRVAAARHRERYKIVNLSLKVVKKIKSAL